MKLSTAIKLLEAEYERAKQLEFVYNPLAYALHQVRKIADMDMKTTKGKRRKG